VPRWIDSARYDIKAKAEGNPGRAMMSGPMLQTLLEDRFKLKIHRETKDAPVYALVAAKNGPRLHSYEEGSCTESPTADNKPRCGLSVQMNGPNIILEFRRMSRGDFPKVLSILDRPIVDKTEIAGRFNFRLEFSPDERTPAFFRPDRANAGDTTAAASIFTALQEQRGLKLEPVSGSRETIVIDHVEKPDAN
jgi:uncharacterized protein (TIGR03435 family)